jgi:flagellar basal-body rod modification protein FlgD
MLTQVSNVLTTKDKDAVQTSDNTALKKDDFLKLLITQIQNQDPTDPMDSKEFTEQLTVLAQLEQSYNFTDTLKQFGDVITGLNKTNIVSLLGKRIKVGDGVVSADGTITAEYTLPQNAELVKVQIADDLGNIVKEIEIPGQLVGNYTLSWDGKDSYGNQLSGVYRARVIAYSNGNIMEGVNVYSIGTVNSVDLQNETVTFGNVEIPFDSVVEVMS